MGKMFSRRPAPKIDKKIITKDADIRRRTRWIINYVAMTNDLSNQQMAEALSMQVGSFSNLRVMNSTPKPTFIKDFCGKFNINELWLLRGDGEPFAGARTCFPDVCGPEAPHIHPLAVNDRSTPYNHQRRSADQGAAEQPYSGPFRRKTDFSTRKISDVLTMAARVLESGTSYAAALELNIIQFSRAVEGEADIAQLEKNLLKLKTDVEKLNKRHKELDQRSDEPPAPAAASAAAESPAPEHTGNNEPNGFNGV